MSLILMSVSLSASSVSTPILSRNAYQLSSEVWSDDFENVTRSLDEWTFDGWDPPNITLSNGLLYTDGPDTNLLTHNSTTAVGTWSFDLFLEESNDYFTFVYFMSPYWELDWFDYEGNVFYIYTVQSQNYYFLGNDQHIGGMYDLDEVQFISVSGWRHIDITRQSDHNMFVFLNGVLLLQGTDSDQSTSEFFKVLSSDYAVFDNITVSDTVDLDGVPPHWTEPLVNHTINYAENFSYALSAADYSGLDTWWLDSNLLFKISDEGVVTSRYPMPVGNFEVGVHVNDTFGNMLSGSFNVEVLPLSTDTTTSPTTDTGPPPLSPLTITLFGVVGVVWVVAVVFMYRDYRGRKTAC